MGLRIDCEASREADSLNDSGSENLFRQFSGEQDTIKSIKTRHRELEAIHMDVMSTSKSGSSKQIRSLDSPPEEEGTLDKTAGSQAVKTSLNNYPSFPNPSTVATKSPRGDNAGGDPHVGQSVDGWVLRREEAFIGENRNTELHNPSVLAVSNSGEFIFVERGRLAAHVFDPYGAHRLTLEANTTLRHTRTRVDAISGFIRDAAFSKANHIIICDCSRYVKIFSKNGKYLCAFITTAVNDSCRGQVRLNCLAVGPKNRIFVGDWNRRCVTVHDPNGSRSRLIECTRPARLAVSEDFLIVLPADPMDSIKLLDHQGNTRGALSVPTSLCPWQPMAVTCSSQTIIVVNGQDGGKRTLHQFALNGVYEGCVTRNLVEPSCVKITQTGEELVVTDNASLKIFQKC